MSLLTGENARHRVMPITAFPDVVVAFCQRQFHSTDLDRVLLQLGVFREAAPPHRGAPSEPIADVDTAVAAPVTAGVLGIVAYDASAHAKYADLNKTEVSLRECQLARMSRSI